MGQIKQLLDFIFEEEMVTYPEDMDLNYEQWLAQREAEQSAYEELLSDIK
jgi:hypothetical protein